jgi:putative ABC transport system permease protein
MATTSTPGSSQPATPGLSLKRWGRWWSPGSLVGVLRVVSRRLWSHLGLMLAIAVGFIVAIGLTVSIPVYAEAVGYRILRDELAQGEAGSKRPPFAFMFRYLGSQSGVISWRDYAPLDEYMRTQLTERLDLPITTAVRYVATDKAPLMPSSGVGKPLIFVNTAFATDFEQHIDIIDGAFPQPASTDGPIEVLISEDLSARLGFQVGEEYLILGPQEQRVEQSYPIRIAGVWRVRDPGSDYWFYDPTTLYDTLFVPEESFRERLTAINPKPVYVATWYAIADGSSVRSSDVADVRARINRIATDITTILPGSRIDISPAQALAEHQRQVQRLTLILTIFSIPVLGLIAYFILLVAGLVVQRQSNEIAVLRSRGASRIQVLGIYLIEGLLLGIVALAAGAAAGQGAGLLMTWTRSFLDVQPGELLPIALTPDAWQRAWQMLALMVIASLLPAFGVARYTIVSFKSERARATRKPFWQRMYLDLLLLIPVYYGYTLLQQRGTVSFLGTDDPFANPLLLLAPTLYIFTLALVATRIFPLTMSVLERLAQFMSGVATVMALRYLARTPGAYTGPVLLLTLTLSLATFTASMAQTLDRHLIDQVYYENGSDVRFYDLGQGGGLSGPMAGMQPQQPRPSDAMNEARFMFLPVTDYLTIPGVAAATRVSVSQVEISLANRTIPARFIGVDRVDLPGVIHWRDDYAGESLGALMNRLADDPAAVLVNSAFAAQNRLRPGDRFEVIMNDLDRKVRVPVIVAGYVNLFPTVYPGDGPFLIGNLDYAFDMQGGQYPYDVWLRLTPGADRNAIDEGIRELGLRTFERGFAPATIITEHARPERQGFYGLLSVGFIASAFLTVLGFLFYSALSFQRRFVELGMLRAIGLSTRQLGALLAWEQALIIGVGMIGGTLIGVTASQLFIPFLQVRRGANSQIPPFVVQIAWEQITIIYIIFGAMLLAAVLITIALLRQMKLFQAVKLGEAI